MSPTVTRPTLADRGLVVLLALLCAAITVGSAAASVWLRTTADDLATRLFDDALHSATQVKVTYTGVTDDYVRPGAAEQVDRALPPALRDLLDEPRRTVVSPEMVPKVLPPQPGWPAFLTVAGLPGLDQAVEIVDGRMPRSGNPVREMPPDVAATYDPLVQPGPGESDGPLELEVVEVILEESAAEEMGVGPGTWIEMSATAYRIESAPPAMLRVVGTYRPVDPYPSALDDLDTARKPSISRTPESVLIRATALAADEETVFAATWQAEPDVRWTFDPTGTPPASQMETIVDQGRRVELQSWPNVAHADDAGALAGLGDLAESVVTQRGTSDGMSLLGLTSLVAGGFAVLLAAAVVLAGRRTEQTTVVRARGASHAWLVAQRGAEALLVVAPGLAAALLVVAVRGDQGLVSLDAAVGLVAALACAALVTAAQTAPRGEGTLVQLVLRDAVQLVLVALTVAVAVLVLRRGEVDTGDPVTLLVAPLVGATAAVVVIRLLQLLLTGLRGIAARTRRVTPVVGMSQALGTANQVMVAAGAVVLALSSAVLSTTLTDTLRHGAEQTGWEQVGADLVVQAPGLSDEVVDELRRLPGVDALAPVFSSSSVSLDTRLGVEGVRLLAFDPEQMRRVGRDSPQPVDLPSSSGEELVAIGSPELQLDGGRAELRYAQSTVPVRVVDRLDRIPGVTTGEPFIAVEPDALAEATGRSFASYDAVLVRGDVDPAAVARVVRERSPQAVVLDRAEITDERLDSPVLTRTTALLTTGAVAAVVVAGFAVVFVVSLGGPVRRRTSALLVAVGADVRQARRVSALGVVPIVAAACVAALLAALALVSLADRGLDLASLTGTLAPLAVQPGRATALGIVLTCLLLVVLAALAAARTRHTEPLDRLGTEHR